MLDRSWTGVWIVVLALAVGCAVVHDDDDAVDDDDTVVDDDDTIDDDDAVVDDDDDTIDDDDLTDLAEHGDLQPIGDDDCAAADDDDVADDDDAAGTFDCTLAPSTAGTETIIAGARGEHGIAIDTAGLIVGSDGYSLIKSDYVGNWSVWLPGVGGVEQMAYLSNGDLIYAKISDGGIHRATPAGGQSLVAPGLNAYGVLIDPNDQIWTAGWNGTVDRIDPGTGAITNMATLPYDSPHSISFSLDYSKLYIGTVGSGAFYSMDLDLYLEPLGAPTVFAYVGGGWHDAVVVDACGYIYVPDYWSTSMYRINPTTAQVTVFADWNYNSSLYGHGGIWGTGVGGWLRDAIYVPMPYGGDLVREIQVGVPGRDWPGTALNLP